MSDSHLCIGIDAGGSKTELLARAVSEDGKSSDEVHLWGPGANPKRIGVEEAVRCLADLVRQALRRHAPVRCVSLCAGVAGAGSDENQQDLAARLRRALGDALSDEAPGSVRVVHDAVIALEAGLGADSGVVVIAGTGSVVFARAKDGAVRRVGGWGYLVGDEGSGYALGRAAFRAVAHALDGGPPTRLRALLAERHGLATREAILDSVYYAKQPVQDVATLILEAAAAEDAVAARILEEQTTLLADQVALLASLGSDTEPRIALFGGLMNEALYVEALRGALQRCLPGWSVQRPLHAPVAGALRLACRAAPV